MAKRRRTTRYQYNRQSMLSLVMVVIAVLLLLCMVGIRAVSLQDKINSSEETKAALKEQIAQEEARTERINAYREYIKSDTFIEEMAREKLGLIKDSEIVFMDKNSNSNVNMVEGDGLTDNSEEEEYGEDQTWEE